MTTPEQDVVLNMQAAEGIYRLAELVDTAGFQARPELRAAIAELCGAVARADRLAPLPPAVRTA